VEQKFSACDGVLVITRVRADLYNIDAQCSLATLFSPYSADVRNDAHKFGL